MNKEQERFFRNFQISFFVFVLLKEKYKQQQQLKRKKNSFPVLVAGKFINTNLVQIGLSINREYALSLVSTLKEKNMNMF